jgi:hypothetical protein
VAETIWVYAEINDDRVTTTSLEMLAKASEIGNAEALLLRARPRGCGANSGQPWRQQNLSPAPIPSIAII